MASATTVRAPASTRARVQPLVLALGIQRMSAACPAASQRSSGPRSSASARASPTSRNPLERAATFTAAACSTGTEATMTPRQPTIVAAWGRFRPEFRAPALTLREGGFMLRSPAEREL